MLYYLKEDVSNGYKCSECERNNNNATTNKTTSTTTEIVQYVAKTSIKIHKYPRIPVIKLKRYCMIPDKSSITGVSSHVINKMITCKRYFL